MRKLLYGQFTSGCPSAIIIIISFSIFSINYYYYYYYCYSSYFSRFCIFYYFWRILKAICCESSGIVFPESILIPLRILAEFDSNESWNTGLNCCCLFPDKTYEIPLMWILNEYKAVATIIAIIGFTWNTFIIICFKASRHKSFSFWSIIHYIHLPWFFFLILSQT